MNLYNNTEELEKHFSKIIKQVDMSKQEALILGSCVEMFEGWDRETVYKKGNTFKRNQVKYLVLQDCTQTYDEPTDFTIFRPLQYYKTYDATTYITCNFKEGEYLLKGSQRISPIDGKTYWLKFDVIECCTEDPSVMRSENPKSWGEIEIGE